MKAHGSASAGATVSASAPFTLTYGTLTFPELNLHGVVIDSALAVVYNPPDPTPVFVAAPLFDQTGPIPFNAGDLVAGVPTRIDVYYLFTLDGTVQRDGTQVTSATITVTP